jgi:hypothetical protein
LLRLFYLIKLKKKKIKKKKKKKKRKRRRRKGGKYQSIAKTAKDYTQ